jgi:hypothetical protein
MAKALHGNILTRERDAFLGELFGSLPALSSLQGDGPLAGRARRLHTVYLPLYLMKRYSPGDLISEYRDPIFSHAIESEILFTLGMKNAASTLLRLMTEAAIKLLYYEYHPIENLVHHTEGGKGLEGKEYREFMYSFPGLSRIGFMQRGQFEKLWVQLCRYAHGDIRAIEKLSIVEDWSSLLKSPAKQFDETLRFIKEVNKSVITLLFAVRHNWAEHMEKVLFDAVFEDFSQAEKLEVKKALMVE